MHHGPCAEPRIFLHRSWPTASCTSWGCVALDVTQWTMIYPPTEPATRFVMAPYNRESVAVMMTPMYHGELLKLCRVSCHWILTTTKTYPLTW
jgi:hypothetical protein